MYTKYGTLKHGFSNFKQLFSQRCHGLRILTIHIQPQLNHHFIPFEEVRNLWFTRYSEKPVRFDWLFAFLEVLKVYFHKRIGM